MIAYIGFGVGQQSLGNLSKKKNYQVLRVYSLLTDVIHVLCLSRSPLRASLFPPICSLLCCCAAVSLCSCVAVLLCCCVAVSLCCYVTALSCRALTPFVSIRSLACSRGCFHRRAFTTVLLRRCVAVLSYCYYVSVYRVTP